MNGPGDRTGPEPAEDPEDDDPWEELTPRGLGRPRANGAPAGARAPHNGPDNGPESGPAADGEEAEGEEGESEDEEPPDELSPRRPGTAPPPRKASSPFVHCPGCERRVPAALSRCPRCMLPLGDTAEDAKGDTDGDRDRGRDGDAGATAGAASGPRAEASATLRFSGGRVDVRLRPGDVRQLGRDQDWAPATARGFADERSVSRRHAEVALRTDGTLWVTEHQDGTTHGTRVNGDYLLPAVPRRLADGDRLVLGLYSEATVSLCGPDAPPDRRGGRG